VNKIFYFYVSSFSLLAFMPFRVFIPCFKGCLYPVLKGAKKTNQQRMRRKKGQPFTRRMRCWSRKRDFPVLLAKRERFGKSQGLYPLGVYRLPAGYSAESFSLYLLRCPAA
jgi:hypothetical protein